MMTFLSYSKFSNDGLWYALARVFPAIQFLLVAVFYSPNAKGQFSEVSANHVIQNICEGTSYGNGVSFYDFDHDGWDDLTLGNGSDLPLFYRNSGGHYTPVSFNMTLEVGAQVIGMEWIDFDNDGDSDFFLTQWQG